MIGKVVIEYNNGKIKTLKEEKHYKSLYDGYLFAETHYHISIKKNAEKYINQDEIDAVTFIIDNEKPIRITKPHIDYSWGKNKPTVIRRYKGSRLILETEWKCISDKVLTRMGFDYRGSKIAEGQGVALLIDLKHFGANGDRTTINEIRLITSEFGIVEWKFEDLDHIEHDKGTGILKCTGLYSKGKILYPPGIDHWRIIQDERIGCRSIYWDNEKKRSFDWHS